MAGIKLKTVLLIQGVYYFIAGIWPIIDINSFMLVTGPKTDIWLVKMVGLLTVGIAVTILTNNKSTARVMTMLAVNSALAYLLIDVYYGLRGVISAIYLADAIIQLIIIIFITVSSIKQQQKVCDRM